MKKLIIVLTIFLFSNIVFAYEYKAPLINDIKDSQSVVYNKETQSWTKAAIDIKQENLNENEILFTKYTTKGSGGYSEYDSTDKQYDTNSTYEFLDENNLIAYNAHSLKFYKLNFNGEKITTQELTPSEIQKYFPDVELVKISEFKNNKIELKKPWFKQKTFMLVNDTKTDFYKYQFENIKSYQIIKGIFETQKNQIFPQTIIYSHFQSRDKMFPILEIKIKNSL